MTKPWTLTVDCPALAADGAPCLGQITVSVVRHVGPGYYYGLGVEDVRPCPVCGCSESRMEAAAYARLEEV